MIALWAAGVEIIGALKFFRPHAVASQARPGRILIARGSGGIESWKAKRRRKKVSMSCSNSRVYGRGAGKAQECSRREFCKSPSPHLNDCWVVKSENLGAGDGI